MKWKEYAEYSQYMAQPDEGRKQLQDVYYKKYLGEKYGPDGVPKFQAHVKNWEKANTPTIGEGFADVAKGAYNLGVVGMAAPIGALDAWAGQKLKQALGMEAEDVSDAPQYIIDKTNIFSQALVQDLDTRAGNTAQEAIGSFFEGWDEHADKMFVGDAPRGWSARGLSPEEQGLRAAAQRVIPEVVLMAGPVPIATAMKAIRARRAAKIPEKPVVDKATRDPAVSDNYNSLRDDLPEGSELKAQLEKLRAETQSWEEFTSPDNPIGITRERAAEVLKKSDPKAWKKITKTDKAKAITTYIEQKYHEHTERVSAANDAIVSKFLKDSGQGTGTEVAPTRPQELFQAGQRRGHTPERTPPTARPRDWRPQEQATGQVKAWEGQPIGNRVAANRYARDTLGIDESLLEYTPSAMTKAQFTARFGRHTKGPKKGQPLADSTINKRYRQYLQGHWTPAGRGHSVKWGIHESDNVATGGTQGAYPIPKEPVLSDPTAPASRAFAFSDDVNPLTVQERAWSEIQAKHIDKKILQEDLMWAMRNSELADERIAQRVNEIAGSTKAMEQEMLRERLAGEQIYGDKAFGQQPRLALQSALKGQAKVDESTAPLTHVDKTINTYDGLKYAVLQHNPDNLGEFFNPKTSHWEPVVVDSIGDVYSASTGRAGRPAVAVRKGRDVLAVLSQADAEFAKKHGPLGRIETEADVQAKVADKAKTEAGYLTMELEDRVKMAEAKPESERSPSEKRAIEDYRKQPIDNELSSFKNTMPLPRKYNFSRQRGMLDMGPAELRWRKKIREADPEINTVKQVAKDTNTHAEMLEAVHRLDDGNLDVDRVADILGEQFGPMGPIYAPQVYSAVKAGNMPKKRMKTVEKAGDGYKVSKRVRGARWWEQALEALGGSAHAHLRRVGEHSPSMTKLMDMLAPATMDELLNRGRKSNPATAMLEDYHLEYGARVGPWAQTFDSYAPKVAAGVREAASTSKSFFTGKEHIILGDELNSQVLGELATGNLTHPLAVKTRVLLDGLYKYAEDHGVPVKRYLKGYLPMFFNHRYMRSKEGVTGFVNMLTEKYGWSEADAINMADYVVTNRGSALPNISAYAGVGKYIKMEGLTSQKRPSRIEFERKLADVDWQDLKPYLENDLFSMVTKYSDDVIRRTTTAKMFGANHERVHKMLADAIRESESGPRPMGVGQVRTALDMIDIFQRTYQRTTENTWTQPTLGTLAFTNALTLVWSAVSSIPDLTMTMKKGGVMNMARTLPVPLMQAAKEIGRWAYKFDRSEREMYLDSFAKGLDQTISERALSLYSGEVGPVNTLIFKANMQYLFTRTANNTAVQVYKNILTRAAKHQKAKRGGKNEGMFKQATRELDEEVLNQMGVDVDELIKWHDSGGTWQGLSEGSTLRRGGLRFVSSHVLHAEGPRMPRWFSSGNPLAMIGSHIKKFPVMIGNVVLKDWIGSNYWYAKHTIGADGLSGVGVAKWGIDATRWMSTMGAMLGMGYLAYQISTGGKHAGDKAPAIDEMELMLRTLGKSGLTAWLGMYIDAARAPAEWGGEPLISLAGPLPSMLNTTGSAMGSWLFEQKNAPIGQVAASMVPIASIHRPTRKKMGRGISSTLTDLGLGTDVPEDARLRYQKRRKKSKYRKLLLNNLTGR